MRLCFCGSLSISQIIHEWIWSSSGMILTGKTEGLGLEKNLSQCHSVHYRSHGLYWEWTQASAVRRQWLTACAMAQTCILHIEICSVWRVSRKWHYKRLDESKIVLQKLNIIIKKIWNKSAFSHCNTWYFTSRRSVLMCCTGMSIFLLPNFWLFAHLGDPPLATLRTMSSAFPC
jgi:hypothetical protein